MLLNLCAVFSQMNRHKDALEAVLNAVLYLQEGVIDLSLPAYANIITTNP